MKNYRMIAFSFVAALTLTGINALAQTMNAPQGTLAKADQSFLDDAVQGDLSEINMGKLAQQKGQSQDVKSYGQMLEQDHGQHLQKAKQEAQQIGVTPPSAPNAKQKKMYDHLSSLSASRIRSAIRTGDGYRPQRRHRQISERGKIEGTACRLRPANTSDLAKAFAKRGIAHRATTLGALN